MAASARCKHVALLSVLKPGEVRIETDTGVESIYVSGGIVEVQVFW
jgi:F-type H+-transporting ATPase subunit epsilon